MQNSRNKSIGGCLVLLLTSIIWGFAFVAQQTGGSTMPPMLFNAARSFVGFFALVALLPVIDLLCGRRPSLWGSAEDAPSGTPGHGKRTLLCGGIICGCVLGMSSLFQQVGIIYTTVGKAGFITALYIVIVPLIGIFFKRSTTWIQWLSSLIAISGVYLLCGTGETGFTSGDFLVLCCAFLFACHILFVDHFAPLTDCVRMSCIQFFITGIISLLAGYCFGERLCWHEIRQASLAIMYCGILSSGAGYTLQIIGQKSVHPVIASLIMSLESVFSVIGGWLILNDRMTFLQLLGCAIIFAAVILSQIPTERKRID